MADLTKLGDGAQRVTEAMMRGAGGRSVLLRVPRPGAANDVTEQLGLAAATFDEVEVAPCTVRPVTPNGKRYELLMAARAVARAAGGAENVLVLAWLRAAAGVVVNGELLRIETVSSRDLAGVPYAYRLELTGPAAAEI
jgi:hypothetical protein